MDVKERGGGGGGGEGAESEEGSLTHACLRERIEDGCDPELGQRERDSGNDCHKGRERVEVLVHLLTLWVCMCVKAQQPVRGGESCTNYCPTPQRQLQSSDARRRQTHRSQLTEAHSDGMIERMKAKDVNTLPKTRVSRTFSSHHPVTGPSRERAAKISACGGGGF